MTATRSRLCKCGRPFVPVNGCTRCEPCRRVLKEQRELRSRMSLPTAVTGAWGELRAATALLSLGCFVFRSLTPSCPCDLVVMVGRDATPLRVEVKHFAADLDAERVVFGAYGGVEYDVLAIVSPSGVRVLFAHEPPVFVPMPMLAARPEEVAS